MPFTFYFRRVHGFFFKEGGKTGNTANMIKHKIKDSEKKRVRRCRGSPEGLSLFIRNSACAKVI